MRWKALASLGEGDAGHGRMLLMPRRHQIGFFSYPCFCYTNVAPVKSVGTQIRSIWPWCMWSDGRVCSLWHWA